MDASVQSGTTSILFTMIGLDDLTGTSDPALQVGIVNGSPLPAPGGLTYDGRNEVDWWYSPDVADIDATRTPRISLPGSIAAKALSAGPGSAT